MLLDLLPLFDSQPAVPYTVRLSEGGLAVSAADEATIAASLAEEAARFLAESNEHALSATQAGESHMFATGGQESAGSQTTAGDSSFNVTMIEGGP